MKRGLIQLSLILPFLVGACASTEEADPVTIRDMPSDAKTTLYVVSEDERFVPEGDEAGRQVYYYSPSRDKAYVVDERSGKVLRTMDASAPREVIVVEEMPEEEMIEEMPEEKMPDEGCGSGAMDDGCAVAIEE